MRVTKDGTRFVRVSISASEVEAFKRRWPASGLPDTNIWFEFDKNNWDLVDMGSGRSLAHAEGSGAVPALSQNAEAYARNFARGLSGRKKRR